MSKSSEFSKYDHFKIDGSLVLSYPGTKIKLERINDETFSYFRKDIENNTTEKIISMPSGPLHVEVCPILPMNLPSRKTNDLMFLRFEKQVYVNKNSKVDVFAPFPIEIGVFVRDNQDKDSSLLDCFTCEPLHSRFALYGTPDNGNLCMYAKVPLKKQYEPFVFALTKISIINRTESGILVGKVVFPVTEHNMYYKENTADTHIDDLLMKIKFENGRTIAKVKRVEYKTPDKSWKIAPPIEAKVVEEFLMDRGID